MLKKILIVAVWGFFGAISRVLIYECFHNSLESYLITFCINLLGSTLLGYLNTRSFAYRKEIVSGYLGSFTTFATLESEFILISEYHAFMYEILYLGISIGCGIIGYEFGHFIGLKNVERRKITI